MKVEIQNLSKKFKEKNVLQEISFCIESSTVCGLLGVNGAGKSTLMKILFGLQSADSGTLFFDDDVADQAVKKEAKLGALIETPAIYMNLSAFDNLKTKALLYGISDEKIKEILKNVGLLEAGKKPAGKFSLGMKQRLGIGMAILTTPDFLILDEPTNGLDPDGIAELLDLVHRLKESGVTILISSHQLHEVSKVADQIVILNQGEICYNRKNEQNTDFEHIFFEIVHGG